MGIGREKVEVNILIIGTERASVVTDGARGYYRLILNATVYLNM